MRNLKYLLLFILLFVLFLYFTRKQNNFVDENTIEKEFATYTPIEVKNFGFDVTIKENREININKIPSRDLHDMEKSEIVIPEVKKILELYKLGKFDDLEAYLKELEERNDPGLSAWVMYYKAHLLFLQKKYSRALRIYQKFMDEFPSHILATNVEEALKFLGELYD
ncbi:MAG: hypothetical protein M0R46_09710 [Candidatus Muirbacterium halophilum]|nr:hypothetical protein [Candidatus Muirbacterium halophilum]